MRVGIGDQKEAVELGDPAVHGGVGGKAGLGGADEGREVQKALLDARKARKGPEHGEVRRPDVGGEEDGLGAALQGDGEEVAAGEAEDGAAVGMEVADGFQPAGELFGFMERGEQEEVVDLAGLAALLVDGADLAREDEAGLGRAGGRGQV